MRYAVRPVEHRHLYEDELLAVSEIELVSRFDDMEVPVLMVLSLKRLDRVCRAVDRLVGDQLHKCGKRSAVVDLAMVDNDIIDLVQVDLFLQVRYKFFRERHPDSIYKYRLLFLYQIGIVCRTLVRGVIVTMKSKELPVDLAYPRNVVFYLLFQPSSHLSSVMEKGPLIKIKTNLSAIIKELLILQLFTLILCQSIISHSHMYKSRY